MQRACRCNQMAPLITLMLIARTAMLNKKISTLCANDLPSPITKPMATTMRTPP